MTVLIKIILIIATARASKQTLLYTEQLASNIPEDATLNFVEIANKYGHKTEEYSLTTEDGYILKMHRIVGDANNPILLVHGAIDSSDSFILRGNTSLAIDLARHNYDVWAINYRGNRYSRQHVKLDPDNDPVFWDFSIDEIGYYDIPCAVDFVLNATGQSKLSTIAFSEGTTSLYVLGATRPETNDKIKVSISLAPICYMHNTGPVLASLINLTPFLNDVLQSLEINEMLSFYVPLRRVYEIVCNRNDTYDICYRYGLSALVGYNSEAVEPEFMPVIVGHFPAGTSRRNFLHLAQIAASKRFAKFDYGPKENLARYKSSIPPQYELEKVKMKTALFVANNDLISTVRNSILLRKRLPNVVDYRVMTPNVFNHVDYVWGRDTYKMMHPQIFEILDKYK